MSQSPHQARIINGKQVAQSLTEQLARYVETLPTKPGLAVILVGDNPASQVYVRNKVTQTNLVGMNSFNFHLPNHTSQEELLKLVYELNERPDVHGILIQLPLPSGLDAGAVIAALDPRKDVDGLHPWNAGLLSIAEPLKLPPVVPCTPLGCLMLIRTALERESLEGLQAVVVGRSRLVGKPLAQLLSLSNATVTLAHSKTAHLPQVCRQADILIAALGRPQFIHTQHVKEGALVIDVGINRTQDGKLVGDVAFESVQKGAGAITPVPGGVGPMTIACLLYNTARAFATQLNIPFDFQFHFGHSERNR